MNKLINEELGVSNDVQKMMDIILKYLIVNFNKTIFIRNAYQITDNNGQIITKQFRYKRIIIENKFSFKQIIFDIYDFPNKEEMKFSFQRLNTASGYFNKYNILHIVCFSINGELYMPFIKRILSHELMHVYRNSFLDGFGDSLYFKSDEIFNTYGFGNLNGDLAYCIYWLNDVEILSHCQEMYNDIMEKKEIKTIENIIKYSDIWNEFSEIKKIVNKIKQGKYNEDFNQQLFNNININVLIKYISEQLKFASIKLGKTLIKCINDKKYINENIRFINNNRKLIII